MPERQRFRFQLFSSWEVALQTTGQPYVDGFFARYNVYLQVIEQGHRDAMGFFIIAVHDEREQRFAGWLYGQIVGFKGKYLTPVFEQEAMKAPWWVRVVNSYETRLFYMGNLFFPGDNGFYLYEEYAHADCRAEIIDAVYPQLREFLLKRCEGGIFCVADYAADTIKEPMIGTIHRFSHFYTEPYMFLKMNPRWKSSEDYIAALSSKYRVRLRKVIAESAQIRVAPMDVEALQANEEIIHQLYLAVAKKASFNLGYVHPGYFRAVMDASGGNFHILGYWLDDRLVGFNSWFTCCHDNLHAHYIGLDYTCNTTHKLYNRMLLDLVHTAIASGTKEIHFGRTAIEIKSTLGAVPANMVIHLRHTQGWASRLMRIPSRWSVPPDYKIRQPFR
jgi:hypothetical protein